MGGVNRLECRVELYLGLNPNMVVSNTRGTSTSIAKLSYSRECGFFPLFFSPLLVPGHPLPAGLLLTELGEAWSSHLCVSGQ